MGMSGKCNCEPTFPLSMLNDFARESWVLGVQAAREAVAGMSYRYAWSDVEVSTYSEGVSDALDAIDALKEEP